MGRGGASRDSRGAVTAELAVLMPVVVMVLGGVTAAGTAVAAQLRCVDAAGTAARSAARGDPGAEVVAAARRAAPPGARVAVSAGPRSVTVSVSAGVPLPLPGRPEIAVGAQAAARPEQPG